MDEQPQVEQHPAVDQRPPVPPGRVRPSVTLPSLLGAAAGILLLGSLSGFLSELSGERLRIGGLWLSLVFEALGVVLLVLSQGRRSSTAGVTLAALGVIPLVFFVFFDAPNESTLVGGDDVVLTSTIALLVAAALWLAGHLFGPSQSHGLFLGAALVAVWLAITIQVVDDQAQPRFDAINQPALQFSSLPGDPAATVRPLAPANTIDDDVQRRLDEYEKYDNGEVVCDGGVLVEGDASFWECDGDLAFPIAVTTDELPFEDDFQVDDFDSGFEDDFSTGFEDDFQIDTYEEEPFDSVLYGSPWGGAGSRFGWSTLLFGLVYLGGGALFDRAGDTRRGTAFFAVASPLAFVGASFTEMDSPWLFGLLYLLIGGVAIWVAAPHDRRFTAWFGTLVATGGLVAVVIDVMGDDPSGTTIGFTLLVVGLAVAAGAHMLDRGPGGASAWRGPSRSDGPSSHLALPVPVPPTGPPTGPPLVPPLVPPPGSQWQPGPVAPGVPTAPAPPASDQAWAPTAPEPGGPGVVAGPAFDPRPPGSPEPLPPAPPPHPGPGADSPPASDR